MPTRLFGPPTVCIVTFRPTSLASSRKLLQTGQTCQIPSLSLMVQPIPDFPSSHWSKQSPRMPRCKHLHQVVLLTVPVRPLSEPLLKSIYPSVRMTPSVPCPHRNYRCIPPSDRVPNSTVRRLFISLPTHRPNSRRRPRRSRPPRPLRRRPLPLPPPPPAVRPRTLRRVHAHRAPRLPDAILRLRRRCGEAQREQRHQPVKDASRPSELSG